ncbi:MAG: winged helix-turn-helix transcriptional regulator [Candidatus Sulfotelmatobacter sp.]
MFIRSSTIIQVLKVADLTTLLALAAIRAHAGPDGTCRRSLPTIAVSLALHPRTMRKHTKVLIELGFVTERPAGRGRTARDLVEGWGEPVEFQPQNLKMGDAFAVWMLLRAMGETFTTKFDDLCRAAGISRPTLKKHLRRLEAAGLLVLTRAARSEYKVNVNAGTSKKSA